MENHDAEFSVAGSGPARRLWLHDANAGTPAARRGNASARTEPAGPTTTPTNDGQAATVLVLLACAAWSPGAGRCNQLHCEGAAKPVPTLIRTAPL
jgi:hypothetical protein